MDKVAVDLGPIQIYWYSILVFSGLLIASIIIFKEARKRNIKEDFLINLICDSIIIGVIGARIYYVLFNLSYYLQNPLEIFAIWNGGLAIHGGVFAALIFIIIYCKKYRVNILGHGRSSLSYIPHIYCTAKTRYKPSGLRHIVSFFNY